MEKISFSTKIKSDSTKVWNKNLLCKIHSKKFHYKTKLKAIPNLGMSKFIYPSTYFLLYLIFLNHEFSESVCMQVTNIKFRISIFLTSEFSESLVLPIREVYVLFLE